VEERASVAEELKLIRQSLSQSISVADHFLRKLRGPIPTDTTAASQKEPSESLVTIVSDIKRQAHVLEEMLAANHEILGNIGTENAPPMLQGRAVGGRG
jgi:nitrogen regulatory protein PII-like uncharacterized protein